MDIDALQPDVVFVAIVEILGRLHNPPMTLANLLDRYRRNGLCGFADWVADVDSKAIHPLALSSSSAQLTRYRHEVWKEDSL